MQMFETYGVEAGTGSIIRELNAVFNVYGISVNHRHLSLVADYMVHTPTQPLSLLIALLTTCVQAYEGVYRGMNRVSMRANTSPFLKMSFESTTDFLKSATLGGDYDALTVC